MIRFSLLAFLGGGGRGESFQVLYVAHRQHAGRFTQYDPDDATTIVREGHFPPRLNWLKDYLDLISVSCVILAAVITFSDMLKELFKKYRCFLISFDRPLIAF